MKRDIYQSITDQIVSELEQGVRPWQKPWSATHMDGRVVLPRRHNGVAYRGVNIITLWMAAIAKGYTAPIWMTFKQAIDLGGCVRKGEKGSLTVYADTITRTETDSASGEEADRDIHYMKGYTVFNVEQIDGLPERYHTKPAPRLEPLPRILASPLGKNSGIRFARPRQPPFSAACSLMFAVKSSDAVSRLRLSPNGNKKQPDAHGRRQRLKTPVNKLSCAGWLPHDRIPSRAASF
jgi:antirestriction protein ArdC